MTATWKEKDLPIIMSGCPLNDIFNADEFGLFYEIVPSKTMHSKRHKCSDGKHCKACLKKWTATWKEKDLPIILSGCPLKDIFNADEFGLFYQTLACKTMHSKGHKCSDGKHCKASLSGLAVVNAFGERLPMFVIGKSQNPKCFKGAKYLPCRYKSILKSWVFSELFEGWVWELDRTFGVEKRKIALIIVTLKLEMFWIDWADISYAKHRLTYAANGPRDHSCFKGKILAIGGKTIGIKLGNKKASMTAISILSAMTWLSMAWIHSLIKPL